ncbi:MAG TPA: VWA domain-containing protein, partial [Fimbriimonadaceae bacterium]|nr:VWA domain-containing protein [Fimbriimonadaceae bacterium]
MNLQDPRALLLLLPLAGVLILLYLLRMRRRDVRVPASFLWPERTDEVRANALFQRLRFSWLLVLQLLALTAVVLALARPQTKQQGLAGEVTVFVIDASASMGATDVEGNRFEAAKRLVVDSIRSADAGDRIALIEAGPQPRVVFSLSSDPLRQLRAVESLERTDGESDVGEAMRLASALVGSYDGARIVLLSDGCFEPIQDFSKGKAAVTFQQVGRGGHNLAITALGLGEGPKGPQLFVGLRSFSLSAIDAVLTITADGAPVHSEKLSIAGRAEWGRTISVPRQVKVFQAQLEAPQDQLGADNYAVALADPGSTLRVLLV